MEAVTIKFEGEFLDTVKKTMKRHRYATKAEFIREAVREKLNDLEKREYMMRAFKLYGAGMPKHRPITNEDLHKTREKVAREMAQELGVELQ